MASLQCLEACKGEAMARVKILNNGRNASDRGGPGLSQVLEERKEVCFQQTHNPGLLQMFLTVSWDLCAERSTPDSDLVSQYFWKHHRGQVDGP